MAKFIANGKRKRWVALTSLALSATLSLGVLAACGGNETPPEEEEPEVSTPTDTQVIKNGNFEFFSEMTETKLSERRNLINDPTSWSITTVSPSSDTKSGIIDTKAETWDYLTKPGRAFTDIDDAYEHWDDEDVTAYDRLKFLDEHDTEIGELESGSDRRVFFDAYRSSGDESYSIDYEDVENLAADFPHGITLHEGAKEGDTNVLMLHNTETSDGVLGTATYATSSTTITLKGGTAAKVTAWVYTDKLYHYYTDQSKDDDGNYTELEKDGGAYIAVTNTVGSNSSSPQFVIKNINTHGNWEQYTLYIRANTYATTTYRIVLGLGRNTSSDNRLEAVNGYAFFDDVVGETIKGDAYIAATKDLPADVTRDLGTASKDRILDATDLATKLATGSLSQYNRTFAFDLLDADEFSDLAVSIPAEDIALTEETSGSLTVTSKVPDNRKEDSGVTPDKQSIAEATTYSALKTRATAEASDPAFNGYLKNIFDRDFKDDKFPFGSEKTPVENVSVIMLLSTNGAAYTAKLENEKFTLAKDKYMLISFFVKTSAIRSGKTGATISLIDGSNKTTISAFDSTTVATVDIDKDTTDIYQGWVQCFFIVKNETDTDKAFSLEFSYGPTSIVGSKVSDYADGYAAFANLQYVDITKAQAGYASTGTYAKSVSLTASTKDTTQFDSAAASYDIEKELSAPANFRGVSADADAEASKNIVTGLLNAEYKEKYFASTDKNLAALKTLSAASDADAWWDGLFGDDLRAARVATQPLVIYNKGAEAAPSYGYTMRSYESTIAANSSQVISMRVKVEANTKAYLYLTDLSNVREDGFNKRFSPVLPSVTYWYDDDGNIVKGDPSAAEFNKKTDVLYYLDEQTGLYTKAGATDGKYYANLHNYKVDEETGNYLTKDDRIAYYYNKETGKAYADQAFTVEVNDLPIAEDGVSITRYPIDRDTADFVSFIEVDGSKITDDTWVDVAFYVRTGNEAKSYLVEIWAGAKGATDGLPAGGYVFVDGYKNESASSYDAIRSERVSALSDVAENRVDPADETSNLKETLALYHTFSFFDSDSFLRYDKSQDEDNSGNPWIDYKQSDYDEGIAWLIYDTVGTENVSEMFIDYSVAEVTVAEHVYDTDDDTSTDDDDTATPAGDTNIWLIISSAVLAVVLIFAIVAVIVRRIYTKHNKGKIKVVKDKAPKKQKAAKKQKEEKAETPERAKDENDPYNE